MLDSVVIMLLSVSALPHLCMGFALQHRHVAALSDLTCHLANATKDAPMWKASAPT
jgi:hypothetical protein